MVLLRAPAPLVAGRQARLRSMHSGESHRASLSGEAVTTAAHPLFNDAPAARALKNREIATRGIMPPGINIFNENNHSRP